MGKPSIFSRDYEKKMKRRRIGIILGVIGIVIACIGGYFYIGKKIKTTFTDKKGTKIEKITTNNKQISSKSNVQKQDEKLNNTTNKSNENGYEIILSSGEKIKLMYEEKQNDKKFKYIYPLDSKVTYDISPTFKKAVIYDEKSQKIILISIDGKKVDITNSKYVSTDESTVIEHDQLLKSKPEYIWCSFPKFIDDNNIVYVSQLPWINKTEKYIWICNISNNVHTCIQNLQGNDINIGKLTDKGIVITVNGNVVYLNNNGEIIS